MSLTLKTAPTVEPLSLTQAKKHLHVGSVSFEDDITTTQTIKPDNHSMGTITGTGVDVSGSNVIVNFISGTNGSSGTVDVHLEDSDDDSIYTDVTDGAFTQVTEANDNATYEKAYTGAKRYLRAIAGVATIACDFAVTIVEDAPASVEDDLITALIKASRRYCEGYQNRAYITQTWELWLDGFPNTNYIDIPLPPLQSLTINYYDVDDTEALFASSNYFVDTKTEPGRVVLSDGEVWPSTTLRPANGVKIEFIAGYGAAGSDVPEDVKQAMLLALGNWYENREDNIVGTNVVALPRAVDALLYTNKVFKF